MSHVQGFGGVRGSSIPSLLICSGTLGYDYRIVRPSLGNFIVTSCVVCMLAQGHGVAFSGLMDCPSLPFLVYLARV